MPLRSWAAGGWQLHALRCYGLVLALLAHPSPLAAAPHLPEDSVLGPALGTVLAQYAARHPPCKSVPLLDRAPFDLSDFIWAPVQEGGLDEWPKHQPVDLSRECLVNPTISRLEGDRFVVVAKVLQRGQIFLKQEREERRNRVRVVPLSPAQAAPGSRCSVFSPTGPWHNLLWLQAPDFLVMAVLQLDLTTGKPLAVVARRVISETYSTPTGYLFDTRLFRSDTGALLLQQFLTNVRTIRPHMRVVELRIRNNTGPSRDRMSLELSRFRSFRYSGTQFEDKNWVPWHGSTMISYTHYPDFQPHTVLDFGGYGERKGSASVVSSTPIPVITALNEHFAAEELSFRGGTPAVPFRGRDGRPEYLAVGHAVASAQCFHHRFPNHTARPQAPRGLGAPWCPQNYLGMHAVGTARSPKLRSQFSTFVPLHHFQDYFFFFYTFSAEPPYRFTRLSDAVIPMRPGDSHAGVTFPTGLDALGPNRFLLSYGSNDDSGWLLALTRAEIEAYLRPIEQVRPDDYAFCSMYADLPL